MIAEPRHQLQRRDGEAGPSRQKSWPNTTLGPLGRGDVVLMSRKRSLPGSSPFDSREHCQMIISGIHRQGEDSLQRNRLEIVQAGVRDPCRPGGVVSTPTYGSR
jgi:hypothetical protein